MEVVRHALGNRGYNERRSTSTATRAKVFARAAISDLGAAVCCDDGDRCVPSETFGGSKHSMKHTIDAPPDLDPAIARIIEELARSVVRRERENRPMTPARFKSCLTALHWTQRGLAAILECDDRLIRRWASGDADIPASVAAWLEALAQAHEALPPPQDWKRRS